MTTSSFIHRPATRADIAALHRLISAAIGALQSPYLSVQQIEASRAFMGLDTQLIDDGTYVVVEDHGRIVGCGGWSRRTTLFGSDLSTGRDAQLLLPERDPAKIRAMYTSPDYTRQGIGRLVLSHCEAGAVADGFSRAELMATKAGEPLYLVCGYRPIELILDSRGGVAVPLVRMEKALP